MEGSVSVNGVKLNRLEYSKVGAYVQQDDALMDILSPREIFTFACRIRLGLGNEDTEKKVDKMVERLSLQSC